MSSASEEGRAASKGPIWLLKQVVLACHDEALRTHGGSDGLRDEGLLDSALARAQQIHTYTDADTCQLAAAYAYGIAKNHPFVDGNKRTAFLAATVFLERNGVEVKAAPAHAAIFMLGLADGSISEAGFAAWLRDNTAAKRRRRNGGKAKGAGATRRRPKRRT